MSNPPEPVIYQLKVVLVGISPMIWRRILVRSDSTIAELHYTLQIAMGWSDSHLHQFIIHGKRYGIYQSGGITFSDDPTQIELSDLGLRLNEKFLYEYDFGDNWQHQIRLEATFLPSPPKFYPVCTAGKRSAPPEDCTGVWRFLELRQQDWTQEAGVLLSQMLAEDTNPVEGYGEELENLCQWLSLEDFDRHRVNRRLQEYVSGSQVEELTH